MHSLSFVSISFPHPPNPPPGHRAFEDLISVRERILRTVISDSFPKNPGDTRTKMEDLKRLKAG